MGERPGEELADHGPLSRALAAAVRGNSTAFGFVSATVFVLVESAALMLAEWVQRRRSDPAAGEHEPESDS